jgi:hypothetical protein
MIPRRNVPPKRGEVWWFDCGTVEKVRPVLIFSVPFAETDRAVATKVFHRTALRGSEFEVKDGALIAQSIATQLSEPFAREVRLTQGNSRTLKPPCLNGWGGLRHDDSFQKTA